MVNLRKDWKVGEKTERDEIFLGYWDPEIDSFSETGPVVLLAAPRNVPDENPRFVISFPGGRVLQADDGADLRTSFRSAAQTVRDLRSWYGHDGEDIQESDAKSYEETLLDMLEEFAKSKERDKTGWLIGTQEMYGVLGIKSRLWNCRSYPHRGVVKNIAHDGYDFVDSEGPVPFRPIRAELRVSGP